MTASSGATLGSARPAGKALVLGAGGFIASHVCRGLLEAGWQVTGVARDPSTPLVVRRLAGLTDDLRLLAGDARDPSLLQQEVLGVDAVFALAGHSGAQASMEQPVTNLQENLITQLVLLEALRVKNRFARVIFAGSRLQYGPARGLPVTERNPQVPNSIYGIHKMTAEAYLRLYREHYALSTTCFRISNAYGPWQARADRAYGLVGTFIALAAQDGTIEVYGGGQQLRDYLYIGDLVELFLIAVSSSSAMDGTFNLGGPDVVSLREAADTIVAVVGRGRVASTPWPASAAAVESGDYVSSIELLNDVFHWKPSTHFHEGVSKTWAAVEGSEYY